MDDGHSSDSVIRIILRTQELHCELAVFLLVALFKFRPVVFTLRLKQGELCTNHSVQ